MAYSQAQVLADTDRRHVLKLVNQGVAQTNTLIVNSAALAFALSTLTVTANATSGVFWPNETITSANSGGTAIVQSVINNTSIKLNSVSGTFANGDTLVGATSNVTRIQSGTVVADTTVLTLSKAMFTVSVHGTANEHEYVDIVWEGNGGGANNRVACVLGSGPYTFEYDVMGARIPNNANNATGNVLLNTSTTYDANGFYTIILDFAKGAGYAAPSMDWRK